MNGLDPSLPSYGGRKLGTFLERLLQGLALPLDPDAALLAELELSLKSLVEADDWLEPAFAQPDPSRYQQHLLFCDPQRRFSVVSFVWAPGQHTPVHDHTVWG